MTLMPTLQTALTDVLHETRHDDLRLIYWRRVRHLPQARVRPRERNTDTISGVARSPIHKRP